MANLEGAAKTGRGFGLILGKYFGYMVKGLKGLELFGLLRTLN